MISLPIWIKGVNGNRNWKFSNIWLNVCIDIIVFYYYIFLSGHFVRGCSGFDWHCCAEGCRPRADL